MALYKLGLIMDYYGHKLDLPDNSQWNLPCQILTRALKRFTEYRKSLFTVLCKLGFIIGQFK
jgi:hypothetical protein